MGPAILLKVMSGDSLSFGVKAFFRSGGTTSGGNNNSLPSILGALAPGLVGLTGGAHGAVADLTNAATGPVYGAVNTFLPANEPATSTTPKAYLNWMLLDNQFHYVSGSNQSGALAAATPDVLIPLATTIKLQKSGYMYIWVSNETKGWDVFFDNLAIQHFSGLMTEENHYYPFGLTMAGISDQALKGAYKENKYRYNAKELQNKEFQDGSGLEEYDYGARFYDPAISRWMVIDPMAEKARASTPYAYGFNNPTIIVDPDGMFGDYFKEDGTYLGSDGKADDKVYAVKNDANIQQFQKDGYLISVFKHSDATDLTQKFGITYSKFKDLTGTVYNEMTVGSRDWKEGAAIYSVLENRGKINNDDRTAWDMAQAGGIYGWGVRKSIDDYKKTDQAKLTATRQGVIAGILNDFDYSGGAYYWQGVDFHKHYDHMHAYESFYLVGFHFTDKAHDIFKIGDHVSKKSYKFRYQSVGVAGKTTFFIKTDAYRKATQSAQWP
jgi:RHS repeat-associated protein